MCTHRASHSSARAGALTDNLLVQSDNDIDCTDKVFHPYGYACVLSDRLIAQSIYCTARICGVSHRCGGVDEFSENAG